MGGGEGCCGGGRPLCHPLLPRKRPRTPAVGAGVGRLSNPNARQGVKGRATTSDGQALNSLVLRAASKLARVKRVSWLCAMPFCLRSPDPKMGSIDEHARPDEGLVPSRRVEDLCRCIFGRVHCQAGATTRRKHGLGNCSDVPHERVAATHPLVTIP